MELGRCSRGRGDQRSNSVAQQAYILVNMFPPRPLWVMTVLHDARAEQGEMHPKLYFPMQNELKIRFRMSSAVVAPVMSSRGRSAP